MWYHPNPSKELFREMVLEDAHQFQRDRVSAIERVRWILFRHYQPNLFPTEYGWVGGREKLMVGSVLFGLDYKQETDFGEHKKIRDCIGPEIIYDRTVTNFLQLMEGIPANPFSPGRYLWDHLDYVFTQYIGEIEESALKSRERKLKRGLYGLFNLENTQMEDFRRVHAMDLKNYLVERFEANDFCPRLQAYWTEAKSRYEAGEIPE